MSQHSPNCFMLLRHAMPWAFVFALANAGKSKPARMAMMAITTRSSMRVKAFRQELFLKDSNDEWARRWIIHNAIVRAKQRLQQIRTGCDCASQGTVTGSGLNL